MGLRALSAFKNMGWPAQLQTSTLASKHGTAFEVHKGWASQAKHVRLSFHGVRNSVCSQGSH